MKIKFFSDNLQTINELKKEYWQLAKKYHPDITGSNGQEMKIINNEYEFLFTYISNNATDKQKQENKKQGHTINDQYREIINAIIHLVDIKIEITGSWVWVTGNTKPYKDILKQAGYYWARKKLAWYWRPADQKSYNRKPQSMQYIRDKYGSTKIQSQPLQTLHPAM